MNNLAQVAEELPEVLATLKGQPIVDLPKDLYIPPDAMKVFLETFEGPLDFLLYLIRKQNIDILDIPIASVTQQYMKYIELMQHLALELAGEYLLMAAILAEIKSRMLLPREADPEDPENDPRAELVKRLQEYEQFKEAALNLDKLPRLERDLFRVDADSSQIIVEKPLPKVEMQDLILAFMDVLKRTEHHASHHIQMEALSVREKMSHILATLQNQDRFLFTQLFNVTEGRMGIVVTFLALLELLKQSLIEFVQAAPFAPIYLQITRVNT